MGSRDKPGNDYGGVRGRGESGWQGRVKEGRTPAHAASDTGLDSSSESPAITSTITSMPVKAPAGPL